MTAQGQRACVETYRLWGPSRSNVLTDEPPRFRKRHTWMCVSTGSPSLDVTQVRAAPHACIFAVCEPQQSKSIKTLRVLSYTSSREAFKAMIMSKRLRAGFLTLATIDVAAGSSSVGSRGLPWASHDVQQSK